MIKISVMSILMFQYTLVDCISTTPIGIIGNKAVILEGKSRAAEAALYCEVRHKCF
ncbi:MAG: hypothetical protein LBP74_07470 [Treponema sp.]|jgi:hypothetical protein|nr:hypothetical protein [Treponema sp.]